MSGRGKAASAAPSGKAKVQSKPTQEKMLNFLAGRRFAVSASSEGGASSSSGDASRPADDDEWEARLSSKVEQLRANLIEIAKAEARVMAAEAAALAAAAAGGGNAPAGGAEESREKGVIDSTLDEIYVSSDEEDGRGAPGAPGRRVPTNDLTDQAVEDNMNLWFTGSSKVQSAPDCLYFMQ
eukprot:tig00021094_g18110.t1